MWRWCFAAMMALTLSVVAWADEETAVAALRRVDAGIKRDDKKPGKPVVAVSLASFSVTDADLAHVKDLPSLEELTLYNCSVTDAGLAHLKGLTNLQALVVNRPAKKTPAITDAGLVHLKNLKNLTYLRLPYSAVTDAGLADLRRSLPKCDIGR